MAKQKKDSLEMQWFLRTGAEAVFGPVDGRGLLLWAEQARVLPGHEVSSDRKSWLPAASLDFLDMRWFIDDGDGELKGPLNCKAAETLIKNGKFSSQARIINAVEAEKFVEEENSVEPNKEAELRPEVKQQVTQSATSDLAEQGVTANDDPTLTLRREAQQVEPEVLPKERRPDHTAEERMNMRIDTALQENARVIETLKKEIADLRKDGLTAQKTIAELQSASRKAESRVRQLETELEERNKALVDSELKLHEAVQIRERALQQSRESERSFARLLSDANKRDMEYKAKIDSLKKNIAISPDQTDQFYRDRNAVYQILKRELDGVTRTMESERQHFESLKSLESERLKELEKHRQQLQNHLGASPVEMTSRAQREAFSDPNSVRLRSELDNLKLAHQRALNQFEERERDLTHKIKVMQADYTKMTDQLLEKERDSEALLAVTEKLNDTQLELGELRKAYEAERKQFVANNNALSARIVELESGGARGGRPEEIQSAEARGVKLASWMSFKK